MKEEALQDYTAAVNFFDFTETAPIQLPFRIVMRAAQGAAGNMLKRSSVMWSLRALAIDLMRTRFFHPLYFTILYLPTDLYEGVLSQTIAAALPGDAIDTDVASLSKNATSLFRKDIKPLQD
ncbi:MAG: hypothetical protein Q9226_008482, partial [Calogaya cf. arnoldii]